MEGTAISREMTITEMAIRDIFFLFKKSQEISRKEKFSKKNMPKTKVVLNFTYELIVSCGDLVGV